MSNVNLPLSLLSFIFDRLFRNDVRIQSPLFLSEQDHSQKMEGRHYPEQCLHVSDHQRKKDISKLELIKMC